MSGFQIFSDGSCDLPKETAKQHNISIVPFYVSLDNQSYQKEIEEISLDSFYDFLLNQKGFPKTSIPSSQDYIDAFIPAIEKGLDIICFTITETLSSSATSASTAKLMLEERYPNSKIYIINSWNATGSQALMAIEASKMQSQGYSIEQVVKYADKAKADARIMFMVGALTHLEKGGRIGKLAALSGNILQIKPLIVLKNGEISTGGATRSRKKGMLKLSSMAKEHFAASGENVDDYVFCVGTTNTWDEPELFASMVKEQLPSAVFSPPFQIGATIAAHTGPGTLGLCFCKKYDCYNY